MLKKLLSKRKLHIYAPINGEVIPLEQVPDPVFSEKMMGEGIAIIPTGGNVHSPINGTVILLSETKHAVALRSNNGTEILIHIGLDTVLLKGQGFTVFVKEGDFVSLGQVLMKVDWDYVKENASSIVTPIVITNSGERVVQCEDAKESIAVETLLITTFSK